MRFGERLKNFFTGNPALTDDMFDDLCDLLIEGDFGASDAYKTVESLKERCRREKREDASLVLAHLLEEELLKAGTAAQIPSDDRRAVVLLLGVNGVGKTTTAAKLGNFYSTEYNKKTILAAADTFRAAAIDQLKLHGQRLGTRVIAHKHGGDPAAVVYDALEASMSGGADVVIADTAGRMHTKSSLVEELRKIDRVVESKASSACYLKYLVLDATTGRNAFAQAEIFHEAVKLDAVILTKYDSTAKGGVVFALASALRLPVAYICSGEKYTDIKRFNPGSFAKEFTGNAGGN